MLLAFLIVQVALGIATLVLAVPVALAAAHQAGAVLLLGISLWVASELRSSRGESRSIVQGAPNVGFS